MNKYFALTEGESKFICWGEETDPTEALPMFACAPILPDDIMQDLVKLFAEKDPEGLYAKKLEEYFDVLMEAEGQIESLEAELTGLPPAASFSEIQ